MISKESWLRLSEAERADLRKDLDGYQLREVARWEAEADNLVLEEHA